MQARPPAASTPGADELNAEAIDCSNPGPSQNLKGCNFNGRNLAGFDLSSTNLRDATFRNANSCGADLSSSMLTNADFRNANLTKADMHSSACVGIKTNARTTFCQTIGHNGAECCSFNVCQGTPKVCCTEEGLLCSGDFECCGTLVSEDSLCEEP